LNVGILLAFHSFNVCSLGITRRNFKRGNDMAEETKIEGIVSEQKTRRSAIKTAAQVAVTAPAVGLLLSAGTKSAMAQTTYARGDHSSSDDNGLDDPISFSDTVDQGG